MLLTACQALCTTLEQTFGANVIETVATVGGLVFVWWRGRQAVAKVETRAIAAETEATKAKTEVRALRLSLPNAVQSSLPPPVSDASGTPEIVPQPDPALLRGEGSLPAPSITPRVDK